MWEESFRNAYVAILRVHSVQQMKTCGSSHEECKDSFPGRKTGIISVFYTFPTSLNIFYTGWI